MAADTRDHLRCRSRRGLVSGRQLANGGEGQKRVPSAVVAPYQSRGEESQDIFGALNGIYEGEKVHICVNIVYMGQSVRRLTSARRNSKRWAFPENIADRRIWACLT